jgi:hypothetical protein
MNFESLLIFLGLNKSKKQIFKSVHSVVPDLAWGYNPRGSAACYAWPVERLAGPRPGGSVRWRSGPGTGTGHARVMARWHACRQLGGDWPMARCGRWARGGHREGVGQGGQGWSSPERRRGVEAVEDASGSGVQWRWGSSDDGWHRWCSPAVSGKEGEGEVWIHLDGERVHSCAHR